MKRPTSEECEQNKTWTDGPFRYMAAFSPQIGGHGSKCVIETAVGDPDDAPCFDVFFWHDGEFPQDDEPPVRLHFCDVEQFERFAQKVRRLQMNYPQPEQDDGRDDSTSASNSAEATPPPSQRPPKQR